MTGDVVNTASRLQTMAKPGTVLLGELTALAVTEAIQFEAVGALQLRGRPSRSEPSGPSACGPSRLVNMRSADYRPRSDASRSSRRLGAALARAFRGQPERWVILAPPGVGKSRLLEEFAERVRADDPAVPILRARARPDVVAPFDPVAQLVLSASLGSAATGIDPDRVLARVVERLLAAGSSPVRARAVAEAMRRPLGMEREAGRKRPAGPTGRRYCRLAGGSGRPDGVPGESLVGRGRPLGRPRHPPVSRIRRFAEDGSKAAGPGHGATFHPRASPRVVPGRWGAGVEAPRVLDLQPLAQVDAAALVRALVGEALPPGLVQTVAERSDGNPLFVEELLRSWITTRVLSPADGGWRLSALTDEIVFPSTVQALYSGQLDDLAPSARDAVRRVSVAGRRFPWLRSARSV